jgi:hypothetical protein
MKFVCDAASSLAAMNTIAERHEALKGHLWMAIRSGVDAHNKHEQSHGFGPMTPMDFEKALAELAVEFVGEERLKGFLELMEFASRPDFYEWL